MSLDSWGVKLKSGVDYTSADWDSIEDIDESEIIPQDNYFYTHGYSGIHQSFINHVLREEDASVEFCGSPCCSLELMSVICTVLGQFINKIDKPTYEWTEESTLEKRTLRKKELEDLYNYLKLLHDNGFVMWFSY